MFTVGIPHLALAFFSAGSAIVAVPTAVQMFAWLATLAQGRPRWNVPMLYIFGFFFIFVLGGLTGVMLAIVPFDWQVHDTYFVVAHLHYVVAGAFAFPLLAALYYWLPLLTGRTAVHRLSVPAFWLIFIGFNLTFLLMHLVGLLGMPRRIFTYAGHEGWTGLNSSVSVGSFIMTIGFGAAGDRPPGAASLRTTGAARPVAGDDAGMGDADPAGALQLRLGPQFESRADRVAAGDARAGPGARRGLPRVHPQRVAGNARRAHDERRARSADRAAARDLPAALDRARHRGRVLAFLFKLYLLALAAALVVAGLFVRGAQSAGLPRDYGPLPVGRGLSVPPHTEVTGTPPWWALIFTLIADGTLFTSLVFGTFYLWIAAPNWPPRRHLRPACCSRSAASPRSSSPRRLARGSLRALAGGGAPQGWIGLAALALVGGIAAIVVADRRHLAASPRARDRRDLCRAARLRRSCRGRAAFPAQQRAAHRRRPRIAEAARRPAPDAALARLLGGDRRDRDRPCPGAAGARGDARGAAVSASRARLSPTALPFRPAGSGCSRWATASGAARSSSSTPCMPSAALSPGRRARSA